jgi:hypothetical protein
VLLPRNATKQECAVTKERHTQECAITKERHTTGMCCYQGTPHNRIVLLPRNATQQECAVTKERHTTGMRCYQGTPHNKNVLLPRNATQQNPPAAGACYLLIQTCTSIANLKCPSINIQNTSYTCEIHHNFQNPKHKPNVNYSLSFYALQNLNILNNSFMLS